MEFVYVVPREKLFPDCYPQGFVPFEDDAERAAFDGLVRRHGFFVEREYAERTPSLKQIIPYTVVCQEDRILCMRRLGNGGEARLHDKLSIGVGGHINPEDLEGEDPDPIRDGTRREIEEEIDVRGSYEIRSAGFLNDDSNPVGAVHLGLVQIALTKGTVEIRETDVLEGRLVARESLSERLGRGENFETWSAIVIRELDRLLPESLSLPQPAAN